MKKRRLKLFDVFSGSGVVARYFKQYARRLIVNDLEEYSSVINRCYLANKSSLAINELQHCYRELTEGLEDGGLRSGFITELYAPSDDHEIRRGERVFFTGRNARYIDTARQRIGELPDELQPFFLAPLLSEASIHANTAGVFKGFYKDSRSGIGCFGGRSRNALLRITGDIRLPFPVFSNFECDVEVLQEDANRAARICGEVDLAYLDPPYNQHPYGSNYFMLNLIVSYQRPREISTVSGIPAGWRRSKYNMRRFAYSAFKDLLEQINAKFLLISFNSEGFISKKDMLVLLSGVGTVEVLETRYNAFRGSRNLRKRNMHVKEYLFLVEKK